LGGIRGAAQPLERELDRPLREYAVIIGEVDRLAIARHRLLTPHRMPISPHQHPSDSGAGEGVVQAEFPQVDIVADFDASLPSSTPTPNSLRRPFSISCAMRRRPVGATAAPQIRRRRGSREASRWPASATGCAVVIRRRNGPGIPEALRDRIFYPLVSGEGGTDWD
jgi:two-component system nitrogen regulation sensor histidine kinase GlnL